MSHNLKPHTRYQVFNVTFVVPAAFEKGEIADTVNETLRPIVSNDYGWLADYAFGEGLMKAKEYETGSKPKEGEPFCAFFKPRRWNLHDASGNAVNDENVPVEAATAAEAALEFLSRVDLDVRATDDPNYSLED